MLHPPSLRRLCCFFFLVSPCIILQELVHTVPSQCLFFCPDVSQIKQRIESLIMRGYIRQEDSRYVYVNHDAKLFSLRLSNTTGVQQVYTAIRPFVWCVVRWFGGACCLVFDVRAGGVVPLVLAAVLQVVDCVCFVPTVPSSPSPCKVCRAPCRVPCDVACAVCLYFSD